MHLIIWMTLRLDIKKAVIVGGENGSGSGFRTKKRGANIDKSIQVSVMSVGAAMIGGQ
jgi:hypothetical protein